MDRTVRLNQLDRADIGLGPAATAENAGIAGIAEVARMFWRRKALLFGTVILVTCLSAIIAFNLVPRYTATARLMINPTASTSAMGELSSTPQRIVSSLRSSLYGEIEVMLSSRMIERVVTDLNLHDDPEFNSRLNPGVLKILSESEPIRSFLNVLGSTEDEPRTEPKRAMEMAQIVETVRSRLKVRPPGLSNVITIQFESRDAEKSAAVVNLFTDTYIADHLDRKFQSNVRARDWLDQRLSDLRNSMVESERTAADFQAARKLSSNGRTTMADQQFADISRHLMEAKASHAEKKLRFEQVQRMIRNPEAINSIREVRASRIIQRLREEEAKLVREIAELEISLGERHPKMVNVRAELSRLQDRIKEEQLRLVDELRNEVKVAAARVQTLKEEVDALDAARASANRDKVRLHQLTREAAANRKLYETLLAEFKQTQQQATLQNSDVEIISPAKVPLRATYPRKGMIVSFGFLASIAIGTFLVLVLERLNSGFRTSIQVERTMNAVSLGSIPKQARSNKGRARSSINSLVVDSPGSPYVEAIRSLRTSLMVSNVEAPPKTILLASSLSGEGKTSLAISLARLSAVSALEGKVIIIDCDLRKPSVAREMGLRPEFGLIHLFSGEATLDDVTLSDPLTGLHVIPATVGTPNPPELLNSHHMRSLIEDLSRRYDTIILDSPAVNLVSDARVLAHLADATVFVVQWETTARHLAVDAFKQLTSAGARIAGVVLQKVNIRKSVSYGYEEAAL